MSTNEAFSRVLIDRQLADGGSNPAYYCQP